MSSGTGKNSFARQIERLFDRGQVKLINGSSFLTGIKGQSQIHGVPIKVRISPLRRSRYQGRRRVGASTLGYRQVLETHSGVPVKFSVAHRGISGSCLIKWVNRLKGIQLVPYLVTDMSCYDVWCNNRDWATRLLNDNEANAALTRLLACAEDDAAIGHPCVFLTAKRITHFRRGQSLQSFDKLREDLENLELVIRVAQGLDLS